MVGQWHGGLEGALTEEPPVGGSVFAANRGHGGTAEGQGEGPATGRAESPSCPTTLLEEGGHRERRPPVAGVVPHRQAFQGLAGLDVADVQGRDLDRLAWQLLVSQVLVQQAVQTLVDLLQIHLFVLGKGRERNKRQRERKI